MAEYRKMPEVLFALTFKQSTSFFDFFSSLAFDQNLYTSENHTTMSAECNSTNRQSYYSVHCNLQW